MSSILQQALVQTMCKCTNNERSAITMLNVISRENFTIAMVSRARIYVYDYARL